VSELWDWTDHNLEDQGRLTHPIVYDADSDRYEADRWDAAFARIGAELNAADDPHQAEFYTSGRASNEAAFLYQLFVRAYGTNNFPDCSNMCHEATSVGLPNRSASARAPSRSKTSTTDRCDLQFRPQSRHQPSAHDDDAA
jgi:anaerobic selenocysteine-containing dehydrogenase